jgi:AsmA protein
MKGKLRYILIAIAVIVVIVLALPFLISVNQFRPTIEEKLSAALGRQVHVGNLSLSILSGSLGADDLSIADDPAFSKSAFLTAKSLNVGVELMPLIFSRALHVTGVTIDKPEVTLLKNPAGRWNFSSLASGPGNKSAPAATSAPATSSAPASSSAPSDLVIGKIEMKDGRLILGATNLPKRTIYDDLNFEATNVSLAGSFPLKLSAKLPGGGTLKLDGTVGPLDANDAALSPVDAKLNIDDLDLAKTGVVDPGSGLGGVVDQDSTLSSKNGQATVQGTVKISKLQVVKGGAPSSTPVEIDFATAYDLQKSTGVLNSGTVKIGKATSHITGTYDLKGDNAILSLKINGQDMPVSDLEAVLPALGVVLPKGASLQNGTLSTNLAVNGPGNKLVTTGNINLQNAKLAGFDLGSKMAALSAFSSVGKSADTSIQKLTSEVRVAPEGIQTTNMDLVMPAIGEMTGGGTVGADSSLNFKMRATLSGPGNLLGGVSGGKTTIPFSIQGTTSDPKFIPDVAGLAGALGSQVGSSLQGGKGAQGVADTLGGILGKKKKPNQ